jgi:hypothetical protein
MGGRRWLRHGSGFQLLFFFLVVLLQAQASRGVASINGEGNNYLMQMAVLFWDMTLVAIACAFCEFGLVVCDC